MFLYCAGPFRSCSVAVLTLGFVGDPTDGTPFCRDRTGVLLAHPDHRSFLFLFSDVFFPLEERLAQPWLWVAEALPLLHPVRLARASFSGEFSPVILWDLFYMMSASVLLLFLARRAVRQRLTN